MATKPTTDDYSRFLDEFLLHLTQRVIEADRHGNDAVAAALRGLQQHFVNQRSKRGL